MIRRQLPAERGRRCRRTGRVWPHPTGPGASPCRSGSTAVLALAVLALLYAPVRVRARPAVQRSSSRRW